MDNSMTVTVADMVISDLTTMYSDQPTFNVDKLAVIVNKVVEEVIKARRYREENYSDKQIETDLYNYKSQIYGISEYDFSHIGAPGEISRSEGGSVTINWIERNKLFAGIIPLAHSSGQFKRRKPKLEEVPEKSPEEEIELTK